MGRSSSSGHSEVEPTLADEEHVLGIIVSLLNHLASDSKERLRLLKKFVENEYEKVDRLLEIRRAALGRLAVVEAEEKVRREEEGEEEEEEEEEGYFYLTRLEGGLFSVQMTDYILAWICMEDDGILAHTKRMMGRQEESLESVIDVLKGEAASSLQMQSLLIPAAFQSTTRTWATMPSSQTPRLRLLRRQAMEANHNQMTRPTTACSGFGMSSFSWSITFSLSSSPSYRKMESQWKLERGNGIETRL